MFRCVFLPFCFITSGMCHLLLLAFDGPPFGASGPLFAFENLIPHPAAGCSYGQPTAHKVYDCIKPEG